MAKNGKKSSAEAQARVPIYRTYSFRDKDPIIDVMRTLAQDAHKSYTEISEESDVSQSTLYNWFHGTTKRPQFCTIAAVAGALGKSIGLVNKGRGPLPSRN